METSPWTSLEIAKLAISTLTPLLVLVLGIRINNSVKASERSSSLRSDIYKAVGGDLNDIYSYLAFVGGWKHLTPAQVIKRKRAVDKAMYTYKPFFSQELFSTYDRFMHEAFAPFGGAGEDARIRSDISTEDGNRRLYAKSWLPVWDDCFTQECNKFEQRKAYDQFLKQLARDLKV
ncbi:hypothetical protein [Variovorax sp. LT1R16]|uniref:hypothetical protein n=1 Tax=Variovorax sp. LT1R16 TaxID=3443728 RepID=UPI003F47DD9C